MQQINGWLGVVGMCLATCACDKAGDPYSCSEGEGPSMRLIARVSRWTGEVVAFEGKDRNGLPIKIDAQNSKDFSCYPLMVSRAQLKKARAGLKASCEAARATGTKAEIPMACMGVE